MSGIARIKDVLRKMGIRQLEADEDYLTVKKRSAQGVGIEDGSATRSIVTAEMAEGVPTGNFL